MSDNATPAAPARALLNEGLLKQLINEFYRRLRAGEQVKVVLHSLLHEVYAQGVAAGLKGKS